MATCEKCGKTYLTKECLNCRKKENNPLSEKEKLFKTIRYAIIFFIGLIIIGTIIDIIATTYFVKTITPSINYMNKTSKDLINQQEKLMKDLNKGLKNPFQKYNH